MGFGQPNCLCCPDSELLHEVPHNSNMVKFHQQRCLVGLVDCFISLLAEFEFFFDSFLFSIDL